MSLKQIGPDVYNNIRVFFSDIRYYLNYPEVFPGIVNPPPDERAASPSGTISLIIMNPICYALFFLVNVIKETNHIDLHTIFDESFGIGIDSICCGFPLRK